MPNEPEARASGIGPPLRTNLLFVLPYLTLLTLFVALPLLIGVALSLQDYDMREGSNGWVGFDNFLSLLHDAGFRRAARNTFLFVLLTVPVFVLLGLFLAFALNNPRRRSSLFRPIFFAFSVVTVSAATLVWRAIPIDLAPSDALAVPAIAVVTVWWSIGIPMILFHAALQRIPAEVYEAASLDNVGRLRTFLFITLPSVGRTFLLVTAIEVVLQLQVFGQALLINGAAPARPLVQFIYETAFRDHALGRGAAASQALLAVITLAALVQVWLNRRWREAV
jgi:multiple sugar transport system permease protein